MERVRVRSITDLLLVQSVLAVFVATIALAVGQTEAFSALIGGLIAMIPNAIFARGVFSSYRADQPTQLLGKIYIAQLYKMILTGLLFGVAFHWLHPVSVWGLLVAFFVVYLVPLLFAHNVRT